MQIYIGGMKKIVKLDDNYEQTFIDLDNEQTYSRGIAIYNNSLYQCVRNPSNDFHDPILYNFYILVYDLNNNNIINKLIPPFPVTDVHNVNIYNDKLWITQPGKDEIIIYDFINNDWKEWYPEGEPRLTINEHRPENNFDIHHFNAITFYDNKIYISQHMWGDSFIYVYDYNTRKQVDKIKIGRNTHDVQFLNDQLIVCSSQNGQLIGNKGLNIDIGGFTRGLLLDKDKIYVGISEMQPRHMRNNSSSQIKIFNYNFNLLDIIYMKIDGPIFQIVQDNI